MVFIASIVKFMKEPDKFINMPWELMPGEEVGNVCELIAKVSNRHGKDRDETYLIVTKFPQARDDYMDAIKLKDIDAIT